MIISEARGDFTLFALFLWAEEDWDEDEWIYKGETREWSVFASAPWLEAMGRDASGWLNQKLSSFVKEYRIRIRGAHVVPMTAPELEELTEELGFVHGKRIVHHREFGRWTVLKGYIITCRPPTAKAA
ncbi:MAG TPA: hypothetical protein VFQ39_05545 [Longimicrobium sp.]|nr:hypothetical protein [Longimicrobium sp.]